MEGSSLQRFEFDGDSIECQKAGDDVFVSVKRVCEALGIDDRSQRAKLDEKEWARGVIITSRDSAGRAQDAYMLHLDSLPLWLATIDASRVAEEARPKLLRYQRECARVLADHFLGRRASQSSQSPHLRGSTKASLPALLRAIKDRVFTPDEVRATFGLSPMPSPPPATVPLDLDKAIAGLTLQDGCTIADVLKMLGLPNIRSNQSKAGNALKRAGWTKHRARSGPTRPYLFTMKRGDRSCLN